MEQDEPIYTILCEKISNVLKIYDPQKSELYLTYDIHRYIRAEIVEMLTNELNQIPGLSQHKALNTFVTYALRAAIRETKYFKKEKQGDYTDAQIIQNRITKLQKMINQKYLLVFKKSQKTKAEKEAEFKNSVLSQLTEIKTAIQEIKNMLNQ